MKPILVLISMLVIGGILFPLFLYIREIKKSKNSDVKDRKIKVRKSNNKEEDRSILSNIPKDVKVENSKKLLEYDDIIYCNENEAILRITENEYAGYVEVRGISFNLLSNEEKLFLEESYGVLLNGVDFPFQQYIQSKRLELDDYVFEYTQNIEKLKEEIDALEKKIDNANEIEEEELKDNLNRATSQYHYGLKLLRYFQNKYIDSELLENRFYVIVKCTLDTSEYTDLSYYEEISMAYNELYNKASIFIDSFSRMELPCKFLSVLEIAEVLYSSFNKDDYNYLKLENTIKARFNHLCTTAKPIHYKKIENEMEIIKNEQYELEKKIVSTINEIKGIENEKEVGI